MLGRHWLFRVSIGANAFVLFYFALYSSSTTFTPTTVPHPPNLPSHLEKRQGQPYEDAAPLLDNSQSQPLHSTQDALNKVFELQSPPLQLKEETPQSGLPLPQTPPQEEKIQFNEPMETVDAPSKNVQFTEEEDVETVNEKTGYMRETPASHDEANQLDIDNEEGGVVISDDKFSTNTINKLEKEVIISERVKAFPCDDITSTTHYGQRGPFWTLYNYVKPRKQFRCDESITYTTHADFTFLDNLIPLLERWEGPLSLALYAPGTDFINSLNRINYLRECVNGSSLVKDYVNFHLFFDYKHTPKVKIPHDPTSHPVNCSAFKPQDVKFGEDLPTYKKSKKLPYPVNVARNVAREMSTTHYILPSDIELYPNPNLIPDFLDMIRRNDTRELQRPNPNKLYVLSIFEVELNVTGLPLDKKELVHMLQNKSAIPFHKYVCANCHRIPKAKAWVSAKVKPGLNIFHVGRRHKPYHHWEPIFIGTKKDPFYDERLTWEGRSDKMTQVTPTFIFKRTELSNSATFGWNRGYILCVLDYEFHILDNAFLVHRPGIKRKVTIPSKNPVVAKQNTVIAKIILPELKQLYGTKAGCYV